nr:hypothetical protein [Brevibacillus laterosporus]
MPKKGSVWKAYKREMREVFNLESSIVCITTMLVAFAISYLTGMQLSG